MYIDREIIAQPAQIVNSFARFEVQETLKILRFFFFGASFEKR